jgi:hypothetical protein
MVRLMRCLACALGRIAQTAELQAISMVGRGLQIRRSQHPATLTAIKNSGKSTLAFFQ